MCGVAGVVRLRPEAGEPAEAVARRMAGTLRHRGPDAASAYRSPSGRCVLGHTRLQVIDLETGDQPMPNEDGSVQVVYNGEIYNFRALRSELEAAGHRFRSTGDTEVLVHGYEEWGDRVVERVDGMFAFALWDEARGRLLLARDRAGQKPLFLYEKDGILAFASEMKALLELPGVDDTLDPRALPLYLAYGYVPTPGTFYRHVRKLPPAHLLAVEPEGGGEERRYWRLRFRSGDRSREEALAGVREKLTRAVERRLVADVPLGAFLSGGVDSSIVVGLMSRMLDEPVRTFSIGFGGDDTYDETRYARLAAEAFGTDHTEFVVEPGSIELLDRLVDAYDEPFADSSALPTHVVSGLTRDHVTVALTGDGGDEVFAGYLRFLAMRIAGALPGWAAALGDGLGRLLPHHPSFRHPSRRFSRFFRAAALPPPERMLRWVGIFPDRLDELLRPELARRLDRGALLESFREPWDRETDATTLSRTLQLNFETYLPDDLLVKADRCSMAHGLELRSPFLDTELLEEAAALPDRFRIRRTTPKWALREAFADLLPGPILERGKMGFGIPLPTWLRRGWRPHVEERLLAPDARIRTFLRPEPVERLWREHLGGEADHGHGLWALLTLETWLRRGRYSEPAG